MRNSTKRWLITAASLVLLGCILFAGVMTTLKWDFSKLSSARYETNVRESSKPFNDTSLTTDTTDSVRYETNIYEISEPFSDISLMTDTADIVFALSDDGKCSVECYEYENTKHSVTVEKDILVIKRVDTKSWYDYIGFHLGSPKITVYLPETEYTQLSIHESTGNMEIPKNFAFSNVDISTSTGNVTFSADAQKSVKIKTSTGDICVADSSAGSLDLSVTTGLVTVSDVSCTGDITVSTSTGKAILTDISCNGVISTGTTGSISLTHVIAANKFSIERSTGDVGFNSCDAAGLYVKTTTGNVSGSLLTEKVFITNTGTGSVNVPKTTAGGQCEIKTSTGDIKMKIG